jgi:hypothetical protein
MRIAAKKIVGGWQGLYLGDSRVSALAPIREFVHYSPSVDLGSLGKNAKIDDPDETERSGPRPYSAMRLASPQISSAAQQLPHAFLATVRPWAV